MNKIETLSSSIKSINVFDNYILSIIFEYRYNHDALLNPMINKMIQLSLAKYLILAIKDEIIIKPKNSTYTNNLLFSDINSLVDSIASVNEDGTLNVNGYIVEDANLLIAKIRNKIAHGDYIYSDDCEYIIFNFDGNNVDIKVDLFIEFAVNLFLKKYEYKNTQKHVRPLIVTTELEKKWKLGMVSDEFMVGLLKDYIEYSFDFSSSGESIPKEAFECFECNKNKIMSMTTKYKDLPKDKLIDKIDYEVESFIEYFNEKSIKEGWNTSLTYNAYDLDNDSIDRAIAVLKSIKGGKIKYYEAIEELPYYAYRLSNVDSNRTIILNRCFEYLKCLKIMMDYQTPKIEDVGHVFHITTNNTLKVDQDIYAAVEIARLLDFSYLFENYDIEYDKLPLDKINPSVYAYDDIELREANEQVAIKGRKVLYYMNRLTEICTQKNNVENNDVINDERKKALGVLSKKYQDICDSYHKSLELYYDSLLKLDVIQKSRKNNLLYYYNKYLMNRIRDSVSHGNVYVIPNGEINETIVRFEDRYGDDNEIVFSADIPLCILHIILDECTMTLNKTEIKVRGK